MDEEDFDQDSSKDLNSLNSPLTKDEIDIMYYELSGMRAFVLSDADSTSIVGVLMEESSDSFLVRLPVKFLEVEEISKAVKYVSMPFVRLLKSSTRLVGPVPDEFVDLYIDYLKTEGIKHYPDILEDVDVDTDVSKEVSANVPEKPENRYNGPGVSNEEVNIKLRKAIEEGTLIIYDFKTKH